MYANPYLIFWKKISFFIVFNLLLLWRILHLKLLSVSATAAVEEKLKMWWFFSHWEITNNLTFYRFIFHAIIWIGWCINFVFVKMSWGEGGGWCQKAPTTMTIFYLSKITEDSDHCLSFLCCSSVTTLNEGFNYIVNEVKCKCQI